MGIYLIGFFTSILLALASKRICFTFGDSDRAPEPLVFRILSIVPFVLISCFRNNIGTDWKMYKGLFDLLARGTKVSYVYFEPGYQLLNKIVARFTNDSVWMFAVIASIVVGLHFISIYKLSASPVISIYVFFISLCFFSGLNIMRQAVAIAMFFLGIVFLYENKSILFVLVSLMAISMHRSSVIVFAALLIYRMKPTIRSYIRISIISIICVSLLRIVVTNFDIFAKYRQYLNYSSDFRVGDFIISATVWMIAIVIKDKINANRVSFYNMILNFQFLAVLLCLISLFVPMAFRLLMYFQYMPIFLLPEFVYSSDISRRTKQSIFALISGLYIVQWSYYVWIVGISDYISYKSIFSRIY